MLENAQFFASALQLVPAGLVIGLLAAAPVGPVNVFVIQRTLARGFWAGLAAGIGAVLGDGLIAALAAFGFSAAEDVLANHSRLIQVIGGIVLTAFGMRLLLAPAASQPAPHLPRLIDHAGAIPQTFFMTITNPGAVLGMFAVVAGLTSAVGGFETTLEPLVLLLAIVSGALLWWLGLTRLIDRIHHKLSAGRLALINRIAGAVLAACGIALLAHAAALWVWWRLPV